MISRVRWLVVQIFLFLVLALELRFCERFCFGSRFFCLVSNFVLLICFSLCDDDGGHGLFVQWKKCYSETHSAIPVVGSELGTGLSEGFQDASVADSLLLPTISLGEVGYNSFDLAVSGAKFGLNWTSVWE